jgi:type II secretory pathway predicted ATPase ExeA
MSLWGNVPHYISATPNPQVALALLERIGSVLSVALPLTTLQQRASEFRTQVDEALQDNPEAMEYVKQLENHVAGERSPSAGPELIEELEQYLRTRRPSTDESSE